MSPNPDPRPHIVTAVLTSDERQGWVNPHLSAALVQLALDKRYKLTYLIVNSLYPVTSARNWAVAEALRLNCDWLVMCDNDVAPPQCLGDVIATAPGPIIALPYFVMMSQGPMLSVGMLTDDGLMKPCAWGDLKEGWNRIEMAGTGCMFISRRVLTKMPKPLFDFPIDPVKGQILSEDLVFTRAATQAGYDIWTNPGYVAGHFRTCDVGWTAALGPQPDHDTR